MAALDRFRRQLEEVFAAAGAARLVFKVIGATATALGIEVAAAASIALFQCFELVLSRLYVMQQVTVCMTHYLHTAAMRAAFMQSFSKQD